MYINSEHFRGGETTLRGGIPGLSPSKERVMGGRDYEMWSRIDEVTVDIKYWTRIERLH